MQLDFLARYMLGVKGHIELDFDRKIFPESFGRFCRNDRSAEGIATRYILGIRARRQGNAIWTNDQTLLMVLAV